jgi:GR25 family glycosyltransferase involved in LPS biosynthesis
MPRLLLLLSIIFYSCKLLAGVLDHVNALKDKESSGHSIKNIDYIYLINLDQRPEKWALCKKQLAPYAIYPYRFSAVNGWQLSFKIINDVGVKYKSGMPRDLMGTSYLAADKGEPHHELMHVVGRTYFAHTMSRGAIGIFLSHLSILKDAYDSGYNTIWVMEDNIQVRRDPRRISRLIEKLDALVGKEGWDILFTDPDTKNTDGKYIICRSFARKPNFNPENPLRFIEDKKISADFKKIGARYGGYSMIIRRSGMKKILDFVRDHQIFLPYDMEYTLPDTIRLYSMNYDLISTRPRIASDNGSPTYPGAVLSAKQMHPTLADYWHDYRIQLWSAIKVNG